MTRTDLFAACAAILVFLVILAGVARGQGHEHGHAQHHDVYRKWMRPLAPAIPCCGAKYDAAGKLVEGGDCYPTEAELRPGADGRPAWWARRDDGRWLEVPDAVRLREVNPDDSGRSAHLCERTEKLDGRETSTIFCFVPPAGTL